MWTRDKCDCTSAVHRGRRIEEAERIFADVEAEVRWIVPRRELDAILDNIGLPNSGINLAFSDSATSGSGDGETLISLKPSHRPTIEYTRQLRSTLATVRKDEIARFVPDSPLTHSRESDQSNRRWPPFGGYCGSEAN
jgi:hypothetical protein